MRLTSIFCGAPTPLAHVADNGLAAFALDHKMHPLEDDMTVAEFHENGGTPLKAVERRCLDCSGTPGREFANASVRIAHFTRSGSVRTQPQDERRA
jgi:hypothetical protein